MGFTNNPVRFYKQPHGILQTTPWYFTNNPIGFYIHPRESLQTTLWYFTNAGFNDNPVEFESTWYAWYCICNSYLNSYHTRFAYIPIKLTWVTKPTFISTNMSFKVVFNAPVLVSCIATGAWKTTLRAAWVRPTPTTATVNQASRAHPVRWVKLML